MNFLRKMLDGVAPSFEKGGPLHLKAKLHEMIHQQRQAQSVMQRVVQIRRRHYGPTHTETAAAETEAAQIED